jgi:hypothetical protein
LVDAQPVPKERLMALGQARGEATREALIAAGAPREAIQLVAPADGDAASVLISLQTRATPELEPQ